MTEFEKAFQKYKGDMFAAARKIGCPHHRAQDAVQEAAARLSQMSTISYIEPSRVRGLFCKVASNRAKSIMAQTLAQQKVVNNWSDYLYASKPMSRKEKEVIISMTVHRALSQLSDMDSYIAWRYFAMEMSLKEVCEDLRKEKNVYTFDHVMKLHRYIKTTVIPSLRSALTDLGGDKL